MRGQARTLVGALIAAVLALGSVLAPAVAETRGRDGYRIEFVRLDEAEGLLYRPLRRGPEARVGLVLMHPNSDFMTALACRELVARGFTVLCANSRFVNTDRGTMIWEELPLDVAATVRYLRDLRGIQRVVLVGHSGGGQLMPFYQNIAENGAAACQVPGRPVQCGDELEGLPPADGVVLLDAHHGYGANILTSIDGSLASDTDARSVDPSLDMFNPANGYDPEGATYSQAFIDRYLRAQAERMRRLTALAESRRRAIDEGRGDHPDDEPFLLLRIDARLWQADTRLVSRTRGAYPVLHGDGSVTVEVARSVRVPSADPESNASFADGAIQNTVRSFLSTHTIRVTDDYRITEDAIEGVDWNSSNTSTPANLEGVTTPLLIMAMTGHYWMVSSELFYEHAASADRELVFVEGASHGFTPCTACESTPGEFGDTVRTTFDHVAGWLRARYP